MALETVNSAICSQTLPGSTGRSLQPEDGRLLAELETSIPYHYHEGQWMSGRRSWRITSLDAYPPSFEPSGSDQAQQQQVPVLIPASPQESSGSSPTCHPRGQSIRFVRDRPLPALPSRQALIQESVPETPRFYASTRLRIGPGDGQQSSLGRVEPSSSSSDRAHTPKSHPRPPVTRSFKKLRLPEVLIPGQRHSSGKPGLPSALSLDRAHAQPGAVPYRRRSRLPPILTPGPQDSLFPSMSELSPNHAQSPGKTNPIYAQPVVDPDTTRPPTTTSIPKSDSPSASRIQVRRYHHHRERDVEAEQARSQVQQSLESDIHQVLSGTRGNRLPGRRYRLSGNPATDTLNVLEKRDLSHDPGSLFRMLTAGPHVLPLQSPSPLHERLQSAAKRKSCCYERQ
ncbi:hypothetical protein BDV10DRAFT_164832 [Aspergillus recurvatus]